MKVVIVNCFDTYEDRIDLLHEFFINNEHDVTIVQSDFRHFKKEKRNDKKDNFIFVETKPYYKNMSLARMTSHYDFAKNAFQIVEDLQPELLYVMVPPNSLARFAADYKRKHSAVKLIFDLIDLWPETMPVGRIKSIPPFTFWRLMRDKSIKYADFVITECNLYQSILLKQLDGINTETLYLAKRDVGIDSSPKLSEDEIHLCYLGSINNIIDIPKIRKLIKSIHEIKPVTLHIIGDGESKAALINEVKDTGALVVYYGKLYDPQQKQQIFDKCQFGLNIMKDTVCVGLTMKSIDYFQAGLPIVNNIQADTAKLVDKNNVGINIIEDNIRDVALYIANCDVENQFEMRSNAKKMFNTYFSIHAFNEKLRTVLRNINFN